ncbi:hypothetical protein SUGI_1192110 [Cryptomeria japonica]|nr:hypothetical protein SUGI_1192110 [Cryptomeria japonica]
MVALFMVQPRFKSMTGPKWYVIIPVCVAYGSNFSLACASRVLLSDPHGSFMLGDVVSDPRGSFTSTGSWSLFGYRGLLSDPHGSFMLGGVVSDPRVYWFVVLVGLPCSRFCIKIERGRVHRKLCTHVKYKEQRAGKGRAVSGILTKVHHSSKEFREVSFTRSKYGENDKRITGGIRQGCFWILLYWKDWSSAFTRP